MSSCFSFAGVVGFAWAFIEFNALQVCFVTCSLYPGCNDSVLSVLVTCRGLLCFELSSFTLDGDCRLFKQTVYWAKSVLKPTFVY